MKPFIAAIAIVAVLVTATRVAADPLPLPSDHVRLTTGVGFLDAPDGSRLILPLGTHVLTYEAWERVDTEQRRLQEQEIRLSAENKSLRKSADNWHPGWKAVVAGVLFGLSAGLYIGLR